MSLTDKFRDIERQMQEFADQAYAPVREAQGRQDQLWQLLQPLLGGLGQMTPEQQAQINEGIQAYLQLAGAQTQDAYSQALAGAAARGNLGGTYEADLGERLQQMMAQNANNATLYGNSLQNQYAQQGLQGIGALGGLLGGQQQYELGLQQIGLQGQANAQANDNSGWSTFAQLLSAVPGVGSGVASLANLFGGGNKQKAV